MCGLAPVSYVDGRQINPNNPQYPGNITSKLQGEYVKLTQDESYGVKIVVWYYDMHIYIVPYALIDF